jgi:HAD superfamily hydrolase (TIGR01509 family)
VPATPVQRPGADARARLALEALVGSWWVAAAAARDALHVAGSMLDPRDVADHTARLARQRQDVSALLRGLATDAHIESPLLRWLDLPVVSPRLLGLAPDVRACVFDLDGVLTTSAGLHAAVWAEALDGFLLERAERGHRDFVPFDPHREYRDHVAGLPRLDGVRAFLSSRGIRLPEGAATDPADAATVIGLASRKSVLFRARLERQGVAAYAGSRSYLQGARMLGLRRAVVSASAHTDGILRGAGLDRLVESSVDAGVFERERLLPKPAPDGLLAACRRLGARPEETAVFETSPLGIAAARAAGVRTVVAIDRDGEASVLRAGAPDIVVGDLSELFG